MSLEGYSCQFLTNILKYFHQDICTNIQGYSHRESFSLFSLGSEVDEGVRQFVETGSSEVRLIIVIISLK